MQSVADRARIDGQILVFKAMSVHERTEEIDVTQFSTAIERRFTEQWFLFRRAWHNSRYNPHMLTRPAIRRAVTQVQQTSGLDSVMDLGECLCAD
jgi:hypothetical protein